MNKKKSFEKFHVRFNLIIILLNFINIYKIFNLIKLIFIRLRYRLSKTILIFFRELIIYVRKLELNFK